VCLVVWHRNVDVDPVALRPRRVHLLEPDRRPLPERVGQAARRPAPAWLVAVAEHRPPERPDLRDVQRVDANLEHLDPARPRGQPELLRHGRDLAGQFHIARRHPGLLGGLQREDHPVRAHVHPQVTLGAGYRRRPARHVGRQRQRPGPHLGPELAQDVPPAEAGDGRRGVAPGKPRVFHVAYRASAGAPA
jgi:hypothetical protein